MTWQERKKLAEQRAKCLADMQGILKKAEDDNDRDLDDAENKSFDDLNTSAESLGAKIEKYDQLIVATAAAADADDEGDGEQRS
jgi:hypothetical protein